MSPKSGSVVAGTLFMVACVMFIVAGSIGDKPVFFALGAAFAAIGVIFLAKAKSEKS